ncbi:hypothetical protein MXB_1896 [Myxobolus squamalis]|nr:hypothetical protein MXB_1896 [Myxobolus squamalis]
MEVELPELPLNDLQKRADEIIDGIRDVDQNIKKVTGRNFSDMRRDYSQRFNRKRIARDKLPRIGNDIHEGSEKSPPRKIHATIENKVSVLSEVVPPAVLSFPAYEEKGEIIDEETSSRSKRMFGNLLGTLKKFKLGSETIKQQTIKRQEIEQKHEERASKEYEEVRKQKRELFQLRREKQRDLRQLRRQIWIKELEERAMTYFESISSYIFLSCDKAIFYHPAKHNEITLKKLEESKEILLKRKDDYVKTIPEFTAMVQETTETNAKESEVAVDRVSSSESSSNEEEGPESHNIAEKISPEVILETLVD